MSNYLNITQLIFSADGIVREGTCVDSYNIGCPLLLPVIPRSAATSNLRSNKVATEVPRRCAPRDDRKLPGGVSAMRVRLTIVGLVLVVALAVVPILHSSSGGRLYAWLDVGTLAGINFFAWMVVLCLLLSREDLSRRAQAIARKFGVGAISDSYEGLLATVMHEMVRKHSAFSPEVIEGKITSKEQLAESLQRVVSHAYKLFDAESAELALLEEETGLYHSSFVMGRPAATGSQAMMCQAGGLNTTVNSSKIGQDVLVHPVSFAGSVLGTLRVALKRGRVPTRADRDILQLLALMSSFAIVNAQYTRELVRLKKVSEESVRAKTGFLANLSHEIRGPLGIIMNAVELVLDGLCGELSKDQIETLSMIKSNSEHLLELINDVLDYAKVESGKVIPQKADVLVNELLQDLAQVVRAQAEAKHHKLVYAPCDEALVISCDRRHGRQMVINILTNAIKYTPDGGVITLWAERASGGKIKIGVKDTGVGIEKADREKVFAPFERIDNSYSVGQTGTGLGMPLTRRLAEVNGASIDFESAPGQGTTFWLTFPAVQFSAFMKEEGHSELPDAEGRSEAVLLVEAHKGERLMVSKYLSSIGFRVIEAEDKQGILEAFRGKCVRLALLDDKSLEDENGRIVRLVREYGPPDIRIVLLSSHAFTFDVERFLRQGIDRCVAKPVPLKKLGHVCREVIDGNMSDSAIRSGRVIRDALARSREDDKEPEDIVH